MSYLDKPWLKSYKLGPYKLEESLAPYPKEPVFKALDDAAEYSSHLLRNWPMSNCRRVDAKTESRIFRSEAL